MAVVAVLGSALYASAGADDAHITAWAAHVLVEHGAYVNYSGEPVELASSLLHVLIVAAISALTGAGTPQTAHALGVGFAMLAVWTTGRLGPRVGGAGHAVPLVATSAFLTYWSVGGLETTLAAWLAALFLLCVHDWTEASTASAGVRLLICALGLCLVRPEGGLVALGAVSLGWLCAPSRRLAGALAAVLLAAAVTAGIHLVWFGQALPQPAYAKVGPLSLEALESGASYLGRHLVWRVGRLPWTAAYGAALLWVAVTLARRRSVPVAVLLAGAWVVVTLGFALLTGGDWMEAARFLVPAVPAGALVVGWALEGVGRARLAVGVLVAWQLALGVHLAFMGSNGLPLPLALDAWARTAELPGAEGRPWAERTNTVHIRDLPLAHELDAWVAHVRAQRPGPVTLLSRQMGLVPFVVAQRHFGAIRVFDRRGLHDRHLLDCPASDGLARLPVGLDLTYDHFFAELDAYAACGVPAPDLIFDVGSFNRWKPVLRRHGYRVVYRQGHPPNPPKPWSEPYVPWTGFIAVHPSLAGRARLRYVDGLELWEELAER